MMAVVTIICSLVSCGKSEDDERETKKSAKETTVEEKNDAVKKILEEYSIIKQNMENLRNKNEILNPEIIKEQNK